MSIDDNTCAVFASLKGSKKGKEQVYLRRGSPNNWFPQKKAKNRFICAGLTELPVSSKKGKEQVYLRRGSPNNWFPQKKAKNRFICAGLTELPVSSKKAKNRFICAGAHRTTGFLKKGKEQVYLRRVSQNNRFPCARVSEETFFKLSS
jgi:hypothetical protein